MTIDSNMVIVIVLSVMKTWLPSVFYLMGIIYICRKLKEKDSK